MSLALWQTLHASPELIDAAALADPRDVAAVARLRRAHPADLVRIALQLAEARRKAHTKFGARADSLWADPSGVEMASSDLAADYKARRFAHHLSGATIVDACCGIGGDAMAFVRAGLRVCCIDLDPIRAWMAGLNTGTQSLCADVSDPACIDDDTRLLHIDPARRTPDGARRLHAISDLQPGPQIVRQLIDQLAHRAASRPWGACIKLGPGIHFNDLPLITGERPFELEIISEHGKLTQALVWLGMPIATSRCATLLTSHPPVSISGAGDLAPPVGPLARFVFEPDDSVERAGLLAELCAQTALHMPHAAVGLLTGDAVDLHPMLRPFEVLHDLAWNHRRVKELLTTLRAGIVEVKTRGQAVNPDILQTELRGTGDAALVVFVLRFGHELRAIIARRFPVVA